MTDATPLFDPRDFHIPEGVVHVCAGGESAPLRRHAAVLSRYVRDKSLGMAGRVAQEDREGVAVVDQVVFQTYVQEALVPTLQEL